MSKLEKIHEVLAMKRSLAERDVVAMTIVLQTIHRKIETMEAKSQAFISGVSADSSVGDAAMLEKWRHMTLGKLSSLQEEKKVIVDKLNVEKKYYQRRCCK